MKIDCKGRKLGFQFDPVRIRYDLLMGREMTVTLENVQDLEGNPIPNKITFTKTIANLNLDDISTSFDFTMNTASCKSGAPIDEAAIRNKISSELALSNAERIGILSASCVGQDIVAKIEIGAFYDPPQRRLRNEAKHHTALNAFYSLMDLATDESEPESRRLLKILETGDPVAFSVSNLQVFPGESDVQEFGLNSDPSPEEELILAAAEGCDSHHLEQKEHMLRMKQSMKEQLNVTQSHMDQKADETASHIDELETHLEMLDHKLDRLLENTPNRLAAARAGREDVEESLDRPDLADLLIQMQQQQAEMQREQHEAQHRMDEQQVRAWCMSFGFCAVAAIAASLYVRAASR